ncbi:MAG TPA: toll/interleukin-1 receptor domain-containing protein [Sphingomicrobium sp.]|jgi:tetratricopeptide (TPR) repeat protein
MAKLARLPKLDRAFGRDPAEGRAPRLRTRYYAFLSYSHKDKELADWLHHELEKFRVPKALAGRLTANGVVPRRLTPIFRDQHDLSAGDDLAVEIEAALAASQFLVALCSPTAATSRWTNLEIESFKRTRPEGCVLAAVVAGEPFASDIPGREAEECFPPGLRYKYDRRGHRTAKKAEPLAADFREGKEGRRIAFLKLVAGMLGVGLDELVQRETTRRQRRLAILAAASLAGMAVTSTLAVTAIQARDAAREQRRQAEGLVAYMLGDLKDKLEPIGRLDALDGVGERVLSYYSNQDASELSDAALVQRSRALSLTAQVAYLRGNYDNATKLYHEAVAGTAEAVRRNPDDPQRLFDHAQNVFWIGDLARQRGNIVQAETYYREYKRLADRMVALEPDNLKWRMEVLYAKEDLGIVLLAERRFAEASRLFGSSLGPMQSLASIDPSNAEYQHELMNLQGWFADAERAAGHLDSAVAARQRQIALLNQAVAAKSDVVLQSDLVTAHEGLGVLLTWKGQPGKGIDEYRAALTQANNLISIEPSNSMWRDVAGNVHLELARALLALNLHDEAAQETAAGCDVAAKLQARDPGVARWRSLQTMCFALRSRLALADGANGPALSFAERSLNSARSERSGDPIADRYTRAGAYRLLGDARKRSGDSESAKQAWTAGIAQLPQSGAENPLEMNQRAELLKRLGRTGEAAPVAARLSTMGFRSATN